MCDTKELALVNNWVIGTLNSLNTSALCAEWETAISLDMIKVLK